MRFENLRKTEVYEPVTKGLAVLDSLGSHTRAAAHLQIGDGEVVVNFVKYLTRQEMENSFKNTKAPTPITMDGGHAIDAKLIADGTAQELDAEIRKLTMMPRDTIREGRTVTVFNLGQVQSKVSTSLSRQLPKAEITNVTLDETGFKIQGMYVIKLKNASPFAEIDLIRKKLKKCETSLTLNKRIRALFNAAGTGICSLNRFIGNSDGSLTAYFHVHGNTDTVHEYAQRNDLSFSKLDETGKLSEVALYLYPDEFNDVHKKQVQSVYELQSRALALFNALEIPYKLEINRTAIDPKHELQVRETQEASEVQIVKRAIQAVEKKGLTPTEVVVKPEAIHIIASDAVSQEVINRTIRRANTRGIWAKLRRVATRFTTYRGKPATAIDLQKAWIKKILEQNLKMQVEVNYVDSKYTFTAARVVPRSGLRPEERIAIERYEQVDAAWQLSKEALATMPHGGIPSATVDRTARLSKTDHGIDVVKSKDKYFLVHQLPLSQENKDVLQRNLHGHATVSMQGNIVTITHVLPSLDSKGARLVEAALRAKKLRAALAQQITNKIRIKVE